MDNPASPPESIFWAGFVFLVSLAQTILAVVAIPIYSPRDWPHLSSSFWMSNAVVWVLWIASVIFLWRRQGWARIAILLLVAWNVGNLGLRLIDRHLWLRLPESFWIRAVWLWILWMAFVLLWRGNRGIGVLVLLLITWSAASVVGIERDEWGLATTVYIAGLRLGGAFLMFKPESSAWFRNSRPT
jgi:hypothetical protein